ncbi:MAG TPA: MarR family transcriptional regulator [Iamia sp.]|nr:MarR family transcriptional regulator [Iamia sp.]
MTSPTTTTAPPLTETAASLRLAVGRLSRRMRQESTLGHSLTQIGIMVTLERQGPTTFGDLAQAERVAPPTITKAVATLIGEGLVEKIADPDDRRVHRAQLTPTGRAALESIRRQREAWLTTRLATLTPEEADQLVAVLPLLEALTTDEA